jgi:hypothetical protein
MLRIRSLVIIAALLMCNAVLFAQSSDTLGYFARDPQQPIDQQYTQHIKEYTTEPYFNSPLTDYLPASKTVPTPEAVLGDVSGAPNTLPYAETVYKYFRLLARSTPRVRVYTIGHTEEGREMIAVAIADQSLLDQQPANNARLAKLADPRTIHMDDKVAAQLENQSYPVYYITGTIHSIETGAPTALMELAYRLAVDNSPYIQYIRSHMIVLITPVVEVDGRDRMVDIYRWHRAHPNEQWPHLLYWGHYVAHDNNRDAMGMSLDLTRNVLNTYLGWHAQVLHDLHESVPFLYDNTVGDGPYNAWIDPILTGEWQQLGWNNVQTMTQFGMPGVFTHGDFDTWSPGYLMFLAAMHNGISRLYETFGNGGADTEKRILDPDEYQRTWYKPNPPLPETIWSQRDNNNYEETALLSTLSYFSHHGSEWLQNYYLKSKHSVEKPTLAGPAAYVIYADGASSRRVALLRIMRLQHVEIQRLDQAVTITQKPDIQNEPNAPAVQETIPAGSYVIRMDQTYSRIADALLDRQYWAPNDPQKHPYDDTGWSFPCLFGVHTLRVTDEAILKAPMTPVTSVAALEQNLDDQTLTGSGIVAVDQKGEISLLGLRYAIKDANVSIADADFDAAGHHFHAGSLLIQGADTAKLRKALHTAALQGVTLARMPKVKIHSAPLPRIAFMHTWLTTQTEGWWRLAFDKLHVPYAYISTQTVAKEDDLRSKYDVIIFAPVSYVSDEQIIDGMPMWGNPIPWEKSAITPNLGQVDSTADMRPELGLDGLQHLKNFVRQGGLLIASESTARFAIDEGMAPGVFLNRSHGTRVVGSVLNATPMGASPVLAGYNSNFAVYSESGMTFSISDEMVRRYVPIEQDYHRPTGRGGPNAVDTPEARPPVPQVVLPSPAPWQATPLNIEQTRNNPWVIPAADRPQVLVRFGPSKGLLLSGLLTGGSQIANRPVVVDAHYGHGNTLLFAINPVYRGETIGSYPLVFNAILNFDQLSRTAQ